MLFLCYSKTFPQLNEQRYHWQNVAIGGGGFVSGIITSKEHPGLIYARTDVGGAYRWNPENRSWVPLMDWVSEQQQGMLGVESMAIDPQNPAVVYALTGTSYLNKGKSYILKSLDFGDHFSIIEVTSQFKAHGNGMGRQSGEKLQVDPLNSSILYCGSRGNGLFKSQDQGLSWQKLNSLNVTTTDNGNGVSFIILDKSKASIGKTDRIFAGISRAGAGKNLYRSDDAGETFSAIDNPQLGEGLMPQRAILSGDGTLIITYGNGAGPHSSSTETVNRGQIWKYNINDNTWLNITPPAINRAFGGISVDPHNPKRLIASTINTYVKQGKHSGDRIFLSNNGGESWTDIIAKRGFLLNTNGFHWAQDLSIHWAGSIEFDPSHPERVFVTSGNGIFVNDKISTANEWKFEVRGLEETVPLNLVSVPNGPLISVIGDYDGFTHYDPSKYPSIHSPSMGTTTGLAYAYNNRRKVVRVGTSLFYSLDTAKSWTKTTSVKGAFGQVSISTDGNIIVHSPDKSNTSYRTADDGISWTKIQGLEVINAHTVSDGSRSDSFYAYDPATGFILRSMDGGCTFKPAGNAGKGGSKVIRSVPGKAGHIWIAGNKTGLLRSVNSGETFSRIASVSVCSAVGVGKEAPGSNYETLFIYGVVDGVQGVYRSINEGKSWIRISNDKAKFGGPGNGQFVMGDMNVYGRVYMSTGGRGIVYADP
ncbi:hypothetical protein [Desertivirga brevis]|uniref:hypothetical protein n=1 Tax=Desertivirga brevis TaxID=2810310 RepID=UPI001A956589|nr:hypothetical protein [Pedobacter sp. SYSU D00873]